MRIGVFTDSMKRSSLDDVLTWCRERGVADLELAVGGWSSAPHLDAEALLRDAGERERLLGRVRDAGAEIAAFNASGNPLHPDADTARGYDRQLRTAVRLAGAMGVERIVAMSGAPGAPGNDAWPVFAGGAYLPDMEGLVEWQWEKRILPYWREVSAWAAHTAPDVRICLELHPGASVYNAESYRRLRAHVGDNVLVNLDPSHFWWQGIDPPTAIAALAGSIGFVHGKDTLIHADRVALHGVIDFRWPGIEGMGEDEMPWHFCVVGEGRADDEWIALLAALRAAGYDGVVSIENEDPRYDLVEGTEASFRALERLIAATPA